MKPLLLSLYHEHAYRNALRPVDPPHHPYVVSKPPTGPLRYLQFGIAQHLQLVARTPKRIPMIPHWTRMSKPVPLEKQIGKAAIEKSKQEADEQHAAAKADKANKAAPRGRGRYAARRTGTSHNETNESKKIKDEDPKLSILRKRLGGKLLSGQDGKQLNSALLPRPKRRLFAPNQSRVWHRKKKKGPEKRSLQGRGKKLQDSGPIAPSDRNCNSW